jgi:hypothetical protein
MKKKKEKAFSVKKSTANSLTTIVIAILSLAWVAPILVVILNSFKKKAYIFKNPSVI